MLGIVADDTGIGGFGARCGEREHAGDVYALSRCGALAEEIPNIAVVWNAQGNGLGGKSYFTYTGDVAAVQAGTDAGMEIAKEKGLLVNAEVIPSPSELLIPTLL